MRQAASRPLRRTLERMECCPACKQLAIPAWRRWLSKERFKCPSCAAWLVLTRPRKRSSLGKHPNFMLFVAYPLLLVGAAILVGLLAGLIAKANQTVLYVLAFSILVTVLWDHLRKTKRSEYEVCEIQGHLSESRIIREAWRLPEFRVAVVKLSLFLVEVLVLAALLPLFVRYVRNAL